MAILGAPAARPRRDPTPGMAKQQPRRNPHISYLWPTPILVRRFGQHQRVNPELAQLFYAYRKRHSPEEPLPYASPDTLMEESNNDALRQLGRFIGDSVFEVAREVNGPYWGQVQDIRVQLTGLWFQITNHHAFHETHVHGNCSWSGVYYVQAGSNPGKVERGVPNGITRFYGPPMDIGGGGHGELGNLYLQDYAWDSIPEDGKLVVFPPHIKHMAFPYAGEQDRIIVSFHAQVHGKRPFRPSENYTFAD